jgi:hypothetical protein
VKIADLINQKLAALGVEKPSPRLVEEVEKLIAERIRAAVEKAVTPRLTARAFASTLAPQKGASGDAHSRSPEQAASRPTGTACVACQDPHHAQRP